uniref:Uncharacterized protein n=1 Tax=Glossina austeni TaxID=7395 RepID=A0A1A9UD28_GLOAU
MITVLKNSLKIEDLYVVTTVIEKACHAVCVIESYKVDKSEPFTVSDCPWEKSRYFILHIFHHLVKYAYKVIFLGILICKCSIICHDRFSLQEILSSGNDRDGSYGVGENTTNFSV